MTEPRIIFFGLDSTFSTVPLEALAAVGLKPCLVVEGGEKEESWSRGPMVEMHRAQPGAFRSIFRKKGAGPIEMQDGLRSKAHALGIDVLRTSDPGAVRARAHIHGQRPDLFVVCSFHCLLPPSVLGLPRLGGLNLHPGQLPSQRGPAPLFWTLKAGKPRIEFAIHMLERGEDTGDVVHSGAFDFIPGTHGSELLRQCAVLASPHLIRAVRRTFSGDLVRIKQSRIGRARCPRPTFRDGLIDPSKTAEEVFTFVGGCVGSYPIFAECGGDRFFIAEAMDYDIRGDLPAEFMLSGDHLMLRCSPGVVHLRLKAEGGALFTAEYIETKPT